MLAQLDLAAMHPVRGSFVDDQLSERYTDLLFSLPTPNGEILVYILIEHQSLDDVNMPLRVLEYLARIWVDFRRRNPNAPLPVIVPIILCHPPQGWQAPRRLGEMFQGHPELGTRDVERLAHASLEQLDTWGRRLLAARSLDEVFE